MTSFISVINLRATSVMPLNNVLNTTNKFTLLRLETIEGKLHPNCIKISITDEDHSEEFLIDLNYNATLKAYDFHQINKTYYPKYQSITVEVLVDENNLDKDLKYSFTIIIKEENDDDDGYFIKRPKSSLGKIVSSKNLEKVK
ncbi:hypothetical protein [Flavobacterium sp.]|uniref:hypothetical protein n=1 Tax=Flavobacterium sp. TaxID=239 RepID=UPI0026181C0D|nr:hypothetical protein [Flavobacterium sp.]